MRRQWVRLTQKILLEMHGHWRHLSIIWSDEATRSFTSESTFNEQTYVSMLQDALISQSLQLPSRSTFAKFCGTETCFYHTSNSFETYVAVTFQKCSGWYFNAWVLAVGEPKICTSLSYNFWVAWRVASDMVVMHMPFVWKALGKNLNSAVVVRYRRWGRNIILAPTESKTD